MPYNLMKNARPSDTENKHTQPYSIKEIVSLQ